LGWLPGKKYEYDGENDPNAKKIISNLLAKRMQKQFIMTKALVDNKVTIWLEQMLMLQLLSQVFTS
jgi:hypothetical protein